MARVLRKLRISDVSSVDRGAAVGARVMLLKRDPEQLARDAVSALETSVASIAADDSVVDKAAAISESLAQFHKYLDGIDPDVGAVAAAAIAKHSVREEVTIVNTVVEKVERAGRVQVNLQAAIDAYARVHRVSKSVAADRVILGTGHMTEMHRLEKQLDAVTLDKLGSGPSARKPTTRELHEQARLNAKDQRNTTVNPASHQDPASRPDVSRPADKPRVRSSDELLSGALDQLNELADRLRKADSTLTKEQAFAKVYADPRNRDLVRQEHRERMAAAGMSLSP
jgi:hypothetical protein